MERDTSMASSSNVSDSSPGETYPYSTEFNVLDFVPKLSAEGNYDNWKSLMWDFIDSQGLIGFVDGTTTAEESHLHDYMAWNRSNNLVRRWILATLNEDTRLRVLCFKTAEDLWTQLQILFDPTKSLLQRGKFKLNTDGCWNPISNKAGFGGVVRDDQANWITGYYGRIDTDSILEAELWAIHKGLILLMEKGISNASVETDSLIAANLIMKGGGSENHPQLTIIEESKEMLKAINSTLSHINRSINTCADRLAHEGAEQEENFVVYSNPPQAIRELMANDSLASTIHYLALQKAAVNGDWDTAKGIIEDDPEAVRTPITPSLQTALHLAISSASPGRDLFVRKLLKRMTPQDVEDLFDKDGDTALHYAAHVDNVVGAKMLVDKNRKLPNVSGGGGQTPLHAAAFTGSSREMVLYLMKVTADDLLDADLLCILTWGELYDIAFTVLQKKPKLANAEPNPFSAIAQKRSSFRSGNSFNFWQKLIYWGVPMRLECNNIANLQKEGGGGTGDMESQVVTNSGISGVPMRLECNNIANLQKEGGGGTGDLESQVVTNSGISVRQRLYVKIWEVAEKLVPCIKRIREKKERQHHALELVKFLSLEVAKSKLSTAESIFKQALWQAARVGIPEIIEEIVVSCPMALYFVNLDGLNIFKYAIMYHHERVFNLIYQVNAGWRYMAPSDGSSNNGLQLAARLRREQQINLRANASGAILQMQRELQWFKEVRKFTPLFDRERRNTDGMTPKEVFSDTHQDLVKEGERWMKDTGTSCTIVAALIATMVFAAAITVPGGNDNNNGHPLLSKQKAFVIFGISDALALFSSITYVITFLVIPTSRYAEEDFLYTLPNRLIIGLITLFFSITSTMVAFGAILYLVFGDNKAWRIPIVALASSPVTLFGYLQFPLLIEMIQSTYGRGIFGKKSNRVLQ